MCSVATHDSYFYLYFNVLNLVFLRLLLFFPHVISFCHTLYS